MYRCDELAVRATTVLTGVRQRICMNLMMASAEHLMSLVDRRAAHDDPKATEEMLEHERAAIERTEAYYKDAANGQAQIVYFAGMALVVARPVGHRGDLALDQVGGAGRSARRRCDRRRSSASSSGSTRASSTSTTTSAGRTRCSSAGCVR